MKFTLLRVMIILLSGIAIAQSSKDSAAVREAALNYVEGWYDGNAERMEKAVHPKLAKRIITWSWDIHNSGNTLSEMNGVQLVDGTRKGYGKNTPKEKQVKNITILSMYNNSASVKAEMTDWIDYMHLGRWNGEWKIINVLWENKPQE
ncbi:MAG: nuclear transport factor 2 family protein [Bacteriovoracaceae bacterium]